MIHRLDHSSLNLYIIQYEEAVSNAFQHSKKRRVILLIGGKLRQSSDCRVEGRMRGPYPLS